MAKRQSLQEIMVNPVIERPTPKRFNDLIEFGVGDFGNRYWKAMLHGDRGSASVMENSITVLDESEWNKYCKRYKTNPSRFPNTLLFGFRAREQKTESQGNEKQKPRMIYVAVGDGAKYFGQPKQMTEEIKYDYNAYWGAVVCANLLRLWPDGCDHVVLALAHPTKSVGQRELMAEVTQGPHYIETVDGRKVRIIVREVLPWDESVGGIVRWSETLSFEYNKYDLKRGSTILVTDIGGGVTSFTRVVVDYDTNGKMLLLPVYDQEQSPSISMGQRNVLDRFRDALNSENPAFRGMKNNLTDDMLEEGLRSGVIYLSGKPVSVTKEREAAEYPFLDAIETTYNNKLAGGRPFALLVNVGGGMHTYYERLFPVWKHDNVELAGDLMFIHLANLFGGDELFRQWIERERHQRR